MPMTKKDILALSAGAVLLVGIVVAASAYYLGPDDRSTEQAQRVSFVQPASARPIYNEADAQPAFTRLVTAVTP